MMDEVLHKDLDNPPSIDEIRKSELLDALGDLIDPPVDAIRESFTASLAEGLKLLVEDGIDSIYVDAEKIAEVKKLNGRLKNKILSRTATPDEVIEWFHTHDPIQEESTVLTMTSPMRRKQHKKKGPNLVTVFDRGANILLHSVIDPVTENRLPETEEPSKAKFADFQGRDREELLDLSMKIGDLSDQLDDSVETTVNLHYAAQIIRTVEDLTSQEAVFGLRGAKDEFLENALTLLENNDLHARAIYHIISEQLFGMTEERLIRHLEQSPQYIDEFFDLQKTKLTSRFSMIFSLHRARRNAGTYNTAIENMLDDGGSEESFSDDEFMELGAALFQTTNGSHLDSDLDEFPIADRMSTHTARSIMWAFDNLLKYYTEDNVVRFREVRDNDLSGFAHELMWHIDMHMAQVLAGRYVCTITPTHKGFDSPQLNRPKKNRAYDAYVHGIHGAKSIKVQNKSSAKAAKKASKAYHHEIEISSDDFKQYSMQYLQDKMNMYEQFFLDPSDQNRIAAEELILPSVYKLLDEHADELEMPALMGAYTFDSHAIAKGMVQLFTAGVTSGSSGKKSKRQPPIKPVHKGRTTVSPYKIS